MHDSVSDRVCSKNNVLSVQRPIGFLTQVGHDGVELQCPGLFPQTRINPSVSIFDLSLPSIPTHNLRTTCITKTRTPPNNQPQSNKMRQTFALLAAVGLVAASPLNKQSDYACNPAHQYPEGVRCVSTDGRLAFVTPTPTPSIAARDFACNPAHQYPEGVKCVSTNGALSLVTPAATSTGFACNPAHSYPNGAHCISTAGSLTLVTPSAAPTTFACNPAHSYPNGASCISTAGSLTLVTPAPTFACNPAHSYPNGAACISTKGSLTLVTPAPTSTHH
jgi:hypothetical protein